MFCPRCGKHASDLGAVEGGNMYSCGFCTNQWVEKYEFAAAPAVPDAAPAQSLVSLKDAMIAATEHIHRECLRRAEDFKREERDAANKVMATQAHQYYGMQLALFQFSDWLAAEIKKYKGVV